MKKAARKLKRKKGKKVVKVLPSSYDVVIKLYTKYPKGNMKASVPAWVHCSCPYFKYYVEVADAARNSSSVITSNGQYPKIRNPRMRPYVCKHILAATRQALRMKPVEKQIQHVKADELERLASLYLQYVPGAGVPAKRKAPPIPSRRLPRRVSGPGVPT